MTFSPLMASSQRDHALTLLEQAWSQLQSRSAAGAHARDRERLSYIVESILMGGGANDAELLRRIVDRFQTLSQRFPEQMKR